MIREKKWRDGGGGAIQRNLFDCVRFQSPTTLYAPSGLPIRLSLCLSVYLSIRLSPSQAFRSRRCRRSCPSSSSASESTTWWVILRKTYEPVYLGDKGALALMRGGGGSGSGDPCLCVGVCRGRFALAPLIPCEKKTPPVCLRFFLLLLLLFYCCRSFVGVANAVINIQSFF